MDYVIDSTTELLHSTGGIAIVGKILERIGFGKNEGSAFLRFPDILKSVIGLFTQARTAFEEIRLFRNDALFQKSLDLSYVPAAETVRLYLEKMMPGKGESREGNPDIKYQTSEICVPDAGKSTEPILSTDRYRYLPV